MLKEKLESDLQLRVCRRELWNVDHFTGWMNEFAHVADKQPVGTSGLRTQALRRWGTHGRPCHSINSSLELTGSDD